MISKGKNHSKSLILQRREVCAYVPLTVSSLCNKVVTLNSVGLTFIGQGATESWAKQVNQVSSHKCV